MTPTRRDQKRSLVHAMTDQQRADLAMRALRRLSSRHLPPRDIEHLRYIVAVQVVDLIAKEVTNNQARLGKTGEQLKAGRYSQRIKNKESNK